jgi:hypothetical protein
MSRTRPHLIDYLKQRKQLEERIRKDEESTSLGGISTMRMEHQFDEGAIDIVQEYIIKDAVPVPEKPEDPKNRYARMIATMAVHIAIMGGKQQEARIQETLEKSKLDKYEPYKKAFWKAVRRGYQHRRKASITLQGERLQSSLHMLQEGAIFFSRPFSDKILPLNEMGQEFIREKMKGMNIEEIKQIKEEVRHITIIEENTTIEDSYEMYGLQQLSRGVLGIRHG